MFTGIIEAMGKVIDVTPKGSSIQLTMESPISNELKIDQSLSHNGVCLTVTDQNDSTHEVTIVKESLDRSNLGKLRLNSEVNLERAMHFNGRLDGHLVQGHVDDTAICIAIEDLQGSHTFTFEYSSAHQALLVDKGSVTINGVSLTVVNPTANTFSVAIIPYTFDHTNFRQLSVGDQVNLEFDIIGKYLQRMAAPFLQNISG